MYVLQRISAHFLLRPFAVDADVENFAALLSGVLTSAESADVVISNQFNAKSISVVSQGKSVVLDAVPEEPDEPTSPDTTPRTHVAGP
jgi:hypothetical protein